MKKGRTHPLWSLGGGTMHYVITHPFALEREMREHYHDQPPTHCFCAHAHEKQGCEMNHLQRENSGAGKQARHEMQDRKKGRQDGQKERGNEEEGNRGQTAEGKPGKRNDT